MPIYEYRCEECDSEFELLVLPGREVRCLRCGSSKLTKLMSVFASLSSKARSGGNPCGPSYCPTCRWEH